MTSFATVRFAEFEFDCGNGELRRSGIPLKLQPQPAKVLAVLVRRAGQVVTRQELAEQVWGSDTFVDFEQGLNYAIRQIRTALDDDAEHPRLLQTLPKRGYRFIGTLNGGIKASSHPGSGITSQPRKIPRIVVTLGLAAGLMALGLAFASKPFRRLWSGTAQPPGIRAIAVLPLRNLSNDPAQEYFSDGMTDELITELAQSSSLRVISHTSVERYKGTKMPLPDIARELNVDAMVEGTVMRAGAGVRITAQLIDGHSDRHIWADSYERDVRNVLALQDEIARDIANEVAIRLRSGTQERLWTARPVVPEAHEAYLKGLSDASKLTPEGLQSGIDHFDHAIELDPQYASAYAGKAEAYEWAAGLSILPSENALPKARTAADKALELDDTLSQAHHSVAWVKYALDWNFTAAEAQFKRAIELNASDTTAHLWYGMFLAQRGRSDESLTEMKRAEELDPLSLMVNALAATPLLESRQYDAAIAQAKKVLLMDPGNGVGHWVLINAYERKGDLANAIDEREKASVVWGQNPEDVAKQTARVRKTFAALGAKGYWQNRLDSFGQEPAQEKADQYQLAVVLARVGQKERAFASLERSYASRSTELLYWLQGEPAFDSMRTDSRFQELLRRVGA
ncbi:MAG TPA: winged helix-turn-helix domain-containing protein [Terriglobales bacterium]|nr:winged helix-turn-helix domain-containing protein [Terriglobales bacterium]